MVASRDAPRDVALTDHLGDLPKPCSGSFFPKRAIPETCGEHVPRIGPPQGPWQAWDKGGARARTFSFCLEDKCLIDRNYSHS